MCKIPTLQLLTATGTMTRYFRQVLITNEARCIDLSFLINLSKIYAHFLEYERHPSVKRILARSCRCTDYQTQETMNYLALPVCL